MRATATDRAAPTELLRAVMCALQPAVVVTECLRVTLPAGGCGCGCQALTQPAAAASMVEGEVRAQDDARANVWGDNV